MKKQTEWSGKDKKKSSQGEFKKNHKENRFQKKDEKKSFSNKPSRYKNYIKKEEDYSDLEKIVGVYSGSKNNDFGFVDVEGQEKGYFVYPKNLNGALDGDEVEAVIKIFNRRKEAVITKVLKRADRILVGKIELVKDFAFVILDNPAFKADVHISNKKLSKYKGQIKNGDKVAIKITAWEGKNPEGSIFEILGDSEKPGVDIMGIALEGGARIRFGESILAEAEKLKFEEDKKRIDLTKKLIFTIDGEDAKDLDDAVGVEKIPPTPLNKGGHQSGAEMGGYKLLVSIADVSQYVKEGSFLDKEAYKRGNSIYLVDRVIPMLPEKLSNDLCSLNPHTKKLTLTCEMVIDEKGNVISKKVYESVISSHFRLTYREVQEILDKKLGVGDELKFGGIISKDLSDAVKLSYELKNIVKSKKQKVGILDFDFPETKIKLDEFGNPIAIEKYERYESMKIIEEFMVLANESVGELYSKLPFVYRVHPVPAEDDIEKLRNTLNIFGFTLPYKTLTPKVLSEILSEISGNPKEKLLQKLILRSLEKAIYSEENVGHFGLNLEYYSHFTSPIRRYPDLQIHRIIKEKLSGKLDKVRVEHYKDILASVSKNTSDTERKAEKLEYAVRDLMICKYYESRIGEEFEGVISGMIESGFFVELDNTAEGFVSIEQVGNIIGKNKFDYDSEHMKFSFSKDLFFQVGDTLKIKIGSVEMEKRRLNFDFLEKIIK